MKKCFRCNRTEEEVRIHEAVSFNEFVEVCEKCAILEGIPLIKRPNIDQLKDSERSGPVYNRLKIISGFKEEHPKKSVLDELRDAEHNICVKKEEPPLNLIENFHWKIQHERRHKGMTQKQLADAIGESETAIKLIERNNLPEGALEIIKKIEQFLRIYLINKKKSLQPLLSKKQSQENKPSQIVNFRKEKLNKITISDLQEIQRNIEKDFPTKSREEIGREQLEGFGITQDTRDPGFRNRGWFEQYKKRKDMSNVKIPTLSELAEKKADVVNEEKKDSDKNNKKSGDDLFGDDIEILDFNGND